MKTAELATLPPADIPPDPEAKLSWFDMQMLTLGAPRTEWAMCALPNEQIDMHPRPAPTLIPAEAHTLDAPEAAEPAPPLTSQPNRRAATRRIGLALSLAGLLLSAGCSDEPEDDEDDEKCGNRCSLSPAYGGEYPDLLNDYDRPPQLYPPDVPITEEPPLVPLEEPDPEAIGFRVDRDWRQILEPTFPPRPKSYSVQDCKDDWYRPNNADINVNPRGARAVQTSPLVVKADASCIGNRDGYSFTYADPTLDNPGTQVVTGEQLGVQCVVEDGQSLEDATDLARSETRVWLGVAFLDSSEDGVGYGFLRWAGIGYAPLYHVPSCS